MRACGYLRITFWRISTQLRDIYFDYTRFYIVFWFLIFDEISLKILTALHFQPPPGDYERVVFGLCGWICTSANAQVVGQILFGSKEFIHPRLLPHESEHSHTFRLARKHKMAIFCGMVLTVLIKF